MSAGIEFELATTPLVQFGAGVLERVGVHAASLGRRAWLITGAGALERSGVVARVEALLAASGVDVVRQRVAGEPDTAVADDGARGAREAGCDLVIGLGGGSVLDAAKAVACLMANGGEALDYLEVVGRGRIPESSAPVLAIPTTAGTGSEATRNAVLAEPRSGVKASIRHASLIPRVALLDPTLTHSLPRPVTAGTGLDALIQLVEPYVSRRRHPMLETLALDGIRRAAVALPRAYADGDPAAREQMMLVAWWSGMALAHLGLGASHALAGPLGGSFPIAHGLACAATMPHVMAANLRVAAREAPGGETIRRYADVARAMGVTDSGSELDTARAGAEAMRRLCRELSVPSLRSAGVTPAAFPDLVARARRTSSYRSNPVDLADEDLTGILEAALGE